LSGCGPLAVGPDGALDRAALRHLNAVEGVAVGTEETGNEVVAATELASTGIELLPPVLMVAAGRLNCLGDDAGGLVWLCTGSRVEIVKSILGLLQIGLHTGEEMAIFAERPAPLVHRCGPDHSFVLFRAHFVLGTTLWFDTCRSVEDVVEVARALTGETVAKTSLGASVGVISAAVVRAVFVETGARALGFIWETA